MKFNKWLRASFDLKHIIIIIVAVIFFIAAMSLFAEKIDSLRQYKLFLDSRNYNYSIIVDKNIDEDCYAYFGTSLTFSCDEDLSEVISSLTFMDVGNNKTRNDFLFEYKFNDLGKYEVVISHNISVRYNLSVGDYLYSRSETSFEINGYKIKGIIDEIYGISYKNISNEKGIILIGKNEDYLNNLKLEYLYFYNEDYSKISDQGAHICGNLYSIEDTKKVVKKNYLFYLSITSLILIVVGGLASILLSCFNINNYHRKKIIGFNKLYRYIKIDLMAYYIIFITITFLNCAIFSIFFIFPFYLFLIYLFLMSIITIVTYFVLKFRMKRR